MIITKLLLEWNFKHIHPKLQHDQIFHVIYFSTFTIRPFNTPHMHAGMRPDLFLNMTLQSQ